MPSHSSSYLLNLLEINRFQKQGLYLKFLNCPKTSHFWKLKLLLIILIFYILLSPIINRYIFILEICGEFGFSRPTHYNSIRVCSDLIVTLIHTNGVLLFCMFSVAIYKSRHCFKQTILAISPPTRNHCFRRLYNIQYTYFTKQMLILLCPKVF